MSNSEHLEKFRSLVEVYEDMGGEPGANQKHMKACLDDPDSAGPDKTKQAKEKQCMSNKKK